MKFLRLFEDTVARLKLAGIADAGTEAHLLLEFCFGLSRSRLILHGEEEAPNPELAGFRSILERRLAREPLHYITGSREFWSLDFIVTPAVLIPRPETEFVLDSALQTIGRHNLGRGQVLDMCTGSGVIAVVLARELEAAGVVAVDKSVDALHIAQRNFQKFGLEKRIFPVCSDLFAGLRRDGRFEVIVANPPYIAGDEIGSLQEEVRDWEPRSALDGGVKGLEIIGRIAGQAWEHLAPGGLLFIEIGADQGEQVMDMFADHQGKEYEDVAVLPDWAGRPRLLQAVRRKK